jgi:hypothetical protein
LSVFSVLSFGVIRPSAFLMDAMVNGRSIERLDLNASDEEWSSSCRC